MKRQPGKATCLQWLTHQIKGSNPLNNTRHLNRVSSHPIAVTYLNLSFCFSDKITRMVGLDFPDLPHLHVSESKKPWMFQAGTRTSAVGSEITEWHGTEDPRECDWEPKRTNIHLIPTPTGRKTMTLKKSITDCQCAQKTATTFRTRMQPAKRVDH